MHKCMNAPPDWDLYRSFLAVMTQGSLSAAARQMGTTPMLVSFTNKEAEKRGHRDVMRADADRRSFQSLVNFLEEIFA